jgi:TorA maturation chaperone TorD
MITQEMISESAALDVARECLYRFLAGAVSDPHAPSWNFILEPDVQRLAYQAAAVVREMARGAKDSLGFGELPTEQLDLGEVLAELQKPGADLREEYDRVFGLVLNRECPPHETEYHASAATFFRSQQLADIAGFYRAFGIEPARAAPERPDHLALELEFMAFLLLKKRLASAALAINPNGAEQAQICDEAAGVFFRDHIAWWAPSFATGLRRKAGSGFYAAVAQVLAAFLPVERDHWGVAAARVPLAVTLIERPEEQQGCMACSLKS